jgi:hypothetical protein
MDGWRVDALPGDGAGTRVGGAGGLEVKAGYGLGTSIPFGTSVLSVVTVRKSQAAHMAIPGTLQSCSG